MSEVPVKTRIFLSYSRKDSDFTHRLAVALEARSYLPDFDQSSFDPNNIASGISAEDEWWKRVQDMIAAAEVMVFIVTPDSAASKVCDEEIAYARGIGKRIIPILRRAVDFAKAPPRLSALNVKIDFTGDSDETFATAIDQLCAALDLDVAWHRENRRLTELALKWDAAARPAEGLMRPADIKAAERLMERRPRSAEPPSALLSDYLAACRMAERTARARSRYMQALFGAVVLLLAATGAGWLEQDWLLEQYRLGRHWVIEQYYWRWVMRGSPLTRTQETAYAEHAGTTFKECAIGCPEMVVVPAGKFIMGVSDYAMANQTREGPAHQVIIAKPFAVGKFTVTFAEWDACTAAEACPKADDSGWGRGNSPVFNVKWNEAKQYADWLSRVSGKTYRLLTEAEWDYAARAGHSIAYISQDDIGSKARCGSCHCPGDGEQTFPLDKPNDFGLYYMLGVYGHGPIYQWVEDCYQDAPNGSAQTNESCGRRVYRGGVWINYPDCVYRAVRAWDNPDSRSVTVGFRLARTLDR